MTNGGGGDAKSVNSTEIGPPQAPSSSPPAPTPPPTAQPSIIHSVGPSAAPTALDALFESTKLSTGGNGARSVAISGDTLVVGAQGEDFGESSGSVNIYIRTGASWTQQARLVASDGAAGDDFGRIVAISGDTLVTSSIFDQDLGMNSGSVYVFIREGSMWTEEAKLTASDGTSERYFGESLAIEGDTLAVGSRWDDENGLVDSGSVFIFTRTEAQNATVWTEQTKLTPSEAFAFEYFGYSVAIAGNKLVVSGYFSVYVFTETNSTWTEQAKLTVSGEPDETPDIVVAVSEDTLVAGAYWHDGNGANSGSAYIFSQSDSMAWTEQAKLVGGVPAAGDNFGESVAILGNTVLVGAGHDERNGTGRAYLFGRQGTTWTEQSVLAASDGDAGDFFGYSVAISEDIFAVVSERDQEDGRAYYGTTYVFNRIDN